MDGLAGGENPQGRSQMPDADYRSLLFCVVLKDKMLFMYLYYVVFSGLSHK